MKKYIIQFISGAEEKLLSWTILFSSLYRILFMGKSLCCLSSIQYHKWNTLSCLCWKILTWTKQISKRILSQLKSKLNCWFWNPWKSEFNINCQEDLKSDFLKWFVLWLLWFQYTLCFSCFNSRILVLDLFHICYNRTKFSKIQQRPKTTVRCNKGKSGQVTV